MAEEVDIAPGELIRRRKRMKLTQAELARLLGISPRRYHDLESGKMAIRTMTALALETVEIRVALERHDPDLVSVGVREKVLSLAYSILGMGSAR